MKLLGKMFACLVGFAIAPFVLSALTLHSGANLDPWGSYFVIICFTAAFVLAIAIVARFILIVAGRIKT